MKTVVFDLDGTLALFTNLDFLRNKTEDTCVIQTYSLSLKC